jgi:hypothetical protein
MTKPSRYNGAAGARWHDLSHTYEKPKLSHKFITKL